jgi:predicted dehydrogenase
MGVDVFLMGMLWFADGRTAMFDCGFSHPLRQWLEITGTQGVVTVPDLWQPAPRAVFEVRHEDKEAIEEVGVEGQDMIVCMLESFSRSILDKTPVRPAPEEAIKTLRVMDALIASARQEKVVDLAT